MNTERNTTSTANPISLRFRRRNGRTPLVILAALVLGPTAPARAGTPPPTAIPFSDIGARATANYQGDALGVTATADGARLRCGFQKLEGHATPEGLWLESTKPGGGQLRLVAVAVGRGGSRVRPSAPTEAASSARSGMSIVTAPQGDQAPLGAPCTRGAPSCLDMPLLTELETPFADVPFYTHAAPNGAIACPDHGTQTLARTGKVAVQDKLVRFSRSGLTEEYSVSVDGVRQDFIVESPPLNPQPSTLNQSMRLELALRGAQAEATASGARLRLEGSGRVLAYSHLRVEDAIGRELTARLEVLSADRLAVTVADANATYPVRIDPTFTDADWVSLNPGLPGANGDVRAIAVDGSGNVYAGGDFTVIGMVAANRIAKWDGSTWSALGSGMTGGWHTYGVNALAVIGTDLYAGGDFTAAGGVLASNIAKWDGHAWSALGSGVSDIVYALAVNGTDLYAGGWFYTANGVTVNQVAKWNGSAWSALGSGIGLGWPHYVYALAVRGTDLYAGGIFYGAGGVPVRSIAKWNGSAWSGLGSGTAGFVFALAVSGTNLYAGGVFETVGGVAATNIAKWDGSAWSALGSGMSGGRYSPMITPAGGVTALAVIGTDLYAGGDFTTAGGVPANNIGKWDGRGWSALGSGLDDEVWALEADGAGHLLVGGHFSLAGTNSGPCIAQANLGSAPTISRPPLTQTAEAGATVNLLVHGTGCPAPTYQWYLNGTNLPSCTSSNLVLTNVLFSASANYTVVISNAVGAVTSAPVAVNVIPAVERRPVPGVKVMGQPGSSWDVDYADALSPAPNWTTARFRQPDQHVAILLRSYPAAPAAAVLPGVADGSARRASVSGPAPGSGDHADGQHWRLGAGGCHQPVWPDRRLGHAGHGDVDQHVAALLRCLGPRPAAAALPACSVALIGDTPISKERRYWLTPQYHEMRERSLL